MNAHLPPCPRCGGRLSWSCSDSTGMAYCAAGQSRRGTPTPRALLCQFRAEIERVGDVGVRFRYPDEVAVREAVRRDLLREFKAALLDTLAPSSHAGPEDPHMIPPRRASPPISPDDLAALRAQLEDAVPWRDGVLTYEQAMHLIKEVERLRCLVQDKDAAISTLVGILS